MLINYNDANGLWNTIFINTVNIWEKEGWHQLKHATKN